MTAIPFVRLDEPHYTDVVQVAPLVRRVIARNPSKFTYHGTGTYLIGGGGPGDEVVVIDPGPRLDEHRDALAAAVAGQRVTAILVTHCHGDHSPLAAWLRAETGAPTIAFGPHSRVVDPDADVPYTDLDEPDDEPDDEAEADAGDDPTAPAADPARIEEPTDLDFDPDVRVIDGDVAASGTGFTLRAVHTPGHTSNHLCFAFDEQRALFTGDHIMGWSTTVIAPPDGDMRAYFDSLRKVQGRDDASFWPTHGAPVTDPGPFVEAFLAHRLAREAAVLAQVRAGDSRIASIVRTLYADVDRKLHKPAARSVLAHLVKLVDDGLVAIDPDPDAPPGTSQTPRLRSTYHPA